jgi:hypothetical protein
MGRHDDLQWREDELRAARERRANPYSLQSLKPRRKPTFWQRLRAVFTRKR